MEIDQISIQAIGELGNAFSNALALKLNMIVLPLHILLEIWTLMEEYV